jgi:hypothetical protein
MFSLVKKSRPLYVIAATHPGRRLMEQNRFKILPGLPRLKSLPSIPDPSVVLSKALLALGLRLTAVWIALFAYALFISIFWRFRPSQRADTTA